jgi:hypothetical protein
MRATLWGRSCRSRRLLPGLRSCRTVSGRAMLLALMPSTQRTAVYMCPIRNSVLVVYKGCQCWRFIRLH